MHEVLVNRLGGLSLPRKSVVRLTDRPDMTLDVYRGRKTTMQQLSSCLSNLKMEVVGWCDGAGYTSSAGASYNLDTVGQGPTALAVVAGGGCLDIFTLIYLFSPLSPSLWETARDRLKYCLKWPLNLKQLTNQI